MASKMENWIAYQERHLTPEAFAQWKAGNVKVQSWLKKQEGVSAAVRQIEGLQKDVLKKVMAPALQKASDYLAQIEKTSADVDSGILKQSIGSTKAKIYPATFCGYVASGPRRGFARAVQVVTNKKGQSRVKRLSKKFTQTTPTTLPIKNPLAYARFLIRGRKALAARKGSGIPLLMGGATFFRSRVKAAPPHDFMAGAKSAAQSAANMATCEMQLNLQKLLPDD